MLPFSLTLRRLLRIYIPQFKDEDINRYESLTALRHQLYHELKYPALPIKNKDGADGFARFTDMSQINLITEKAHNIIRPFQSEFKKINQLYIARKNYIFHRPNIIERIKNPKISFNPEFTYLFIWLGTLPFIINDKYLLSFIYHSNKIISRKIMIFFHRVKKSNDYNQKRKAR